jgi:quercetin dioxygenase-like cupin family protein
MFKALSLLCLLALQSQSFAFTSSPTFVSKNSPSLTQLAMSDDDKKQDGFAKLEKLKSYYHLVVDEKGETSMVKREFQEPEDQSTETTARLSEVIKKTFASPSKITFTRLQGESPWHNCPDPQIVICLSGSWWVKTTDGKTTDMYPGDILWQDNSEDHPAFEKGTKKSQHYSGTPEGEHCDQLILNVDMPNGPIPDSANKPAPF